MELRHLRYFAAVAETRHFGRAAERLHMAQPALSQSIRQLEAELGTPLFIRTTRQVRLTPAGEFLQREVARILAAVEDGVRGVRRIAAGRQGLRPDRLHRHRGPHPAAPDGPHRQARAARARPGDPRRPAHPGPGRRAARRQPRRRACCVRRWPATDSTCAPSTSEPLVLAVAADHRLATEPVVSMADLRTEPFVLFAGAGLGGQRRRAAQLPRGRLRAAPRARGGRHRRAAAAGRRRPRRRARPCLGPGRPARRRRLPRRPRRARPSTSPSPGAPTRPTPPCWPSSTCSCRRLFRRPSPTPTEVVR